MARKPIGVEETRNYVVEDYRNPPEDQVVAYRTKRVNGHLVRFAVLKDGRTVVTSIWHPKDEQKSDNPEVQERLEEVSGRLGGDRMEFRVLKSEVSNRPWGDVDKTRIRRLLTEALEAGRPVADIIREVYAVIRGESVEDTPSENWWGPHHEIREDGAVVLNRNGVIAAAQALADARAEPDLTPEQRRRAARHLLRHYRELKMEPPASLLEAAGERPEGELVRLAAAVAGEMRPSDIPLAPWVDLDALKAGDPDPLEVVVRIPEGRSKRGWYYTRRVLERITAEINSTGLPGLLGHQDPDRVDREFVPPVTHWVGAVVRDEGGKAVLYARGVVDKAAADLKRWLRGNVIRQVSIYGIPTLAQAAGGETHVVDFHPLSIDWTPLNRAGMPTQVVAVGEMDAIGEQMDDKPAFPKGTRVRVKVRPHEEGHRTGTVAQALRTWVYAIRFDGQRQVHKWYIEDELEEAPEEAEAQAHGEMEVVEMQVIGEIAQLFGLPADARPEQVLEAVRKAREAQEQVARERHAELLDRVIGEMVTAEAVRPLVRQIVEPKVPLGADEAAVRKAVGEMLQQDEIRRALGAVFRGAVGAVIAPPTTGDGRLRLNARRVPI